MKKINNGYILTGGTGSGKTTLLNELESLGYHAFDEHIRELVSNKGVNDYTKVDHLEICLSLFRKFKRDFEIAGNISTCFFDRGLPDIIAFLKFSGQQIPDELINECKEKRYNDNVFLVELLDKSQYKTEEHCNISYEDSKKLHEIIKEIYSEFGYNLISVPPKDIGKRIEEILEKI